MNRPKSARAARSVFALLLAVHATALAQGLSLQTGGSYLFTFDSLSYIQPQQFPFPYDQRFFVRHSVGSFAEGDSFKLELFTDASTSAFTTVWGFGVQPPGNSFVVEGGVEWSDLSPPMFPDLRGAARVTVESGDLQIDGFYVQQVVNGNVYANYFPVPEPSVIMLIVIGVLLLALTRQHAPKRISSAQIE